MFMSVHAFSSIYNLIVRTLVFWKKQNGWRIFYGNIDRGLHNIRSFTHKSFTHFMQVYKVRRDTKAASTRAIFCGDFS